MKNLYSRHVKKYIGTRMYCVGRERIRRRSATVVWENVFAEVRRCARRRRRRRHRWACTTRPPTTPWPRTYTCPGDGASGGTFHGRPRLDRRRHLTRIHFRARAFTHYGNSPTYDIREQNTYVDIVYRYIYLLYNIHSACSVLKDFLWWGGEEEIRTVAIYISTCGKKHINFFFLLILLINAVAFIHFV